MIIVDKYVDYFFFAHGKWVTSAVIVITWPHTAMSISNVSLWACAGYTSGVLFAGPILMATTVMVSTRSG